jgi:hypothetical protein
MKENMSIYAIRKMTEIFGVSRSAYFSAEQFAKKSVQYAGVGLIAQNTFKRPVKRY